MRRASAQTPRRRLWPAALCILACAPARAITIAGPDPNVLNVSYNQSFGGVDLSGVVRVVTGSSGCTGSLLFDGISILTAAHCITSAYGGQLYGSSSVSFMGPDGFVSVNVSSVVVNPGWTGSIEAGGDLAVLHLEEAAPSFAARYELFTGSPTAATNVVAGYGYGGTGTNGYDAGSYPFGTLRAGTNQYVRTGSYIGWSNTLLLAQFYNPAQPSTNVLNALHPYSAADQVDIAPGDSGGPTFQNGRIAGVHDAIACLTNSFGCTSPHTSNDSSYGQVFADVSVASNYSWISNQTMVPEPGTVGLMLAGLAVLAVGARRRRLLP